MPAEDPSPEEEELYERRRWEHSKAKEIANQLDLPSYFEEHEEDGDTFLDGYVYAPPERAVEALKALKDAGVEVDIIDVDVEDPKAAKKISKALDGLEWAREIA